MDAIRCNVEALLEVLDARAFITIFRKIDGGEELLRSTEVYNLLSDQEFLGKYRLYKVKGLTTGLKTLSILIEEV